MSDRQLEDAELAGLLREPRVDRWRGWDPNKRLAAGSIGLQRRDEQFEEDDNGEYSRSDRSPSSEARLDDRRALCRKHTDAQNDQDSKSRHLAKTVKDRDRRIEHFVERQATDAPRPEPVSYTHLTLPTIYSV